MKFLVLWNVELALLSEAMVRAIARMPEYGRGLEEQGKVTMRYHIVGAHGGAWIYDVDSHEEFLGAHGIPIPLLADVDKQVARAYGVTAPVLGTRRAVVIVDEQGRVAHRDIHAVGLSFRTVDDIATALETVGHATRR